MDSKNLSENVSPFFISLLQLVSSFVWAVAGSGAPQPVN